MLLYYRLHRCIVLGAIELIIGCYSSEARLRSLRYGFACWRSLLLACSFHLGISYAFTTCKQPSFHFRDLFLRPLLQQQRFNCPSGAWPSKDGNYQWRMMYHGLETRQRVTTFSIARTPVSWHHSRRDAAFTLMPRAATIPSCQIMDNTREPTF